jgi:hypothetical protein
MLYAILFLSLIDLANKIFKTEASKRKFESINTKLSKVFKSFIKVFKLKVQGKVLSKKLFLLFSITEIELFSENKFS